MLIWCDTTLQALLAMGHLFPHLMFVGPHEHELYSVLRAFLSRLGRALSDSDVLVHECETNGGISAVRDVLRPFTRSPRHPRPTLVVLRRFDRLSPDAQFALRRTMEIDQDKCRCLAVSTTTSSVIQPLHSRFVTISCGAAGNAAGSVAGGCTGVRRLNSVGVTGWLRDTKSIASIGARGARACAREGGCGLDALSRLQEMAEAGEAEWRLVVAVASAVEAASDEAASIYLAAAVCRNWLESKPLVC